MDGNTTLSDIGSLIFAQVKEEAKKDFMSHISIVDNTIKFELFNIKNFDNTITIVLRCSINGVLIEVRDDIKEEDEIFFTSGKLKITKSVLEKLNTEINTLLLMFIDKLK